MIYSREDYFKGLGFIGDPFASTNAIHEHLLEKYFVVPPYFYSLVGSTSSPKSSFIIAPRGTGKTAQRVMLEKMAEKNDSVLAVVYDNFPINTGVKLENIELEDHLIKIMRCLIIALLSELNERKFEKLLSAYEKKHLKNLIVMYLNGISSSEISETIRAIKGVSGKIEDIWHKAGNSITSIINAILQAKDVGRVDLSVEKKKLNIKKDEIITHYDFIECLFNLIGITAIYILVDNIDETSATGNNAEKSYLLIKPFILDLRILERNSIVFKFFVWNKIEEYWINDFRKDRIENYEIVWKRDEIEILINERLKAYSNNRIDRLDQILQCDNKIINYIYMFSNNSPRDLINILKCIFDEHLRATSEKSSLPKKHIVIEGIEMFSKSKFEEIVASTKQQNDLKRIKLATFTIPYLYNEVFKCEASTARNILMPWTQAGIVLSSNNKVKVQKSKNPINLYNFSDVRIARYVCSNQKFEDFINRNIIECEECNTINIFDKENNYGVTRWQCVKCMTEFQFTDGNTSCTSINSAHAHQNNRKKNNGQINECEQMSLFD